MTITRAPSLRRITPVTMTVGRSIREWHLDGSLGPDAPALHVEWTEPGGVFDPPDFIRTAVWFLLNGATLVGRVHTISRGLGPDAPATCVAEFPLEVS